jgi:hypothetical protein
MLLAFLPVTLFTLLALLFLATRIVRRPDYAAHMSDPSLVVQERAFVVHGADCQVLITGDSTASTGIDPPIVARLTGLTTCNIASTRPIWDATGTFALDTWLKHNAAPRILVFHFGPEMFYREAGWDHIPSFEAYVLLLRQGNWKDAWLTMLSHPVRSIEFLQFVLKQELIRRPPAETNRLQQVFVRTISIFDQSNGRLNLEAPALKSCEAVEPELYGKLDRAWIRHLREKYQAMGIPTLVIAAPIPACDPHLSQFESALGPNVDVNVHALPVGLFVTGERHFTPEGAFAESALVSARIQAALAQHH